LKSLCISIELPSQEINSSKALFGSPTQPILKVPPDFEMIGHAMLLYFFLYHKTYYTAHPQAGKIKKAPSEDRAFNIKKQLSQIAKVPDIYAIDPKGDCVLVYP
jgi:hypothetical protein